MSTGLGGGAEGGVEGRLESAMLDDVFRDCLVNEKEGDRRDDSDTYAIVVIDFLQYSCYPGC